MRRKRTRQEATAPYYGYPLLAMPIGTTGIPTLPSGSQSAGVGGGDEHFAPLRLSDDVRQLPFGTHALVMDHLGAASAASIVSNLDRQNRLSPNSRAL